MKKQVLELARALAIRKPSILLLDEPMAEYERRERGHEPLLSSNDEFSTTIALGRRHRCDGPERPCGGDGLQQKKIRTARPQGAATIRAVIDAYLGHDEEDATLNEQLYAPASRGFLRTV
jgi:hypothetical protein